MVFDVSTELLGVVEPRYELDEVAKLPDGTEPEVVYDEATDVTGDTVYPVETPLELEAVGEMG